MVQAPSPPPPPFLPPWEKTRTISSHKQGRIEFAFFVAFLSFTIVLVLGRLRYRGTKWMKLCSLILVLGTDKLISYITGLMSQLSSSSDLYVLWVAFLTYLSTLANNSSCYTLMDNEEQKKSIVVQYTVAWSLIGGTLQSRLAPPEILVPVALIFWITVLKIRERKRALFAATRSSFGMAKVTKVIADFSKYKLEKDNKVNKNGPPYYVALQKDATMKKNGTSFATSSHDFITTDNVLEQEGRQGMELKETCFSFAMFWLLLARIAGYYNVDVRVDFDELLQSKEDNNEEIAIKRSNISIASPTPLVPSLPSKQYYKKEDEEEVLFRLVEQELEFLYDYLYTNSYAMYARGVLKRLLDLGIIIIFFVLALPLLLEYRIQDRNKVYVVLLGDHVLDTGFTGFAIIAILVSELIQMGMFLSSKWAKVIYTCAHVQGKTSTTSVIDIIESGMIRIVCLIPRPTFFGCRGRISCAKVKMGQYSILKCYNSIPFSLWFSCWIGSYFELPRKGQDGEKYIEFSPELKKAVVTYLKTYGNIVTKGDVSLKANGVSDETIREYVAKYTLESQARVILIWHIATSLFEEDPLKKPRNPELHNDFQVATKFSKYCAYLVAFNPLMIPGGVHLTQCEFDYVVRELKKDQLDGDYQLEKERDRHRDDEDPEEIELYGDQVQDPILSKGTQLKNDLFVNSSSKDHDNIDHLWKTLAEFWTEMLLFLALCSDQKEVIEAHANRLSVGGELITHLWALLKHKGCQLQRVVTAANTEVTNTANGQEAYAEEDRPVFLPVSDAIDALTNVAGVVSLDDILPQ